MQKDAAITFSQKNQQQKSDETKEAAVNNKKEVNRTERGKSNNIIYNR